MFRGRAEMIEMKTTKSERVFHIDTNPKTATHLLDKKGACGWFEGQWWYISGLGIHGGADSTVVKVSIVPHGDGPNGCRETDVDALLISAKEQSGTKVLARA